MFSSLVPVYDDKPSESLHTSPESAMSSERDVLLITLLWLMLDGPMISDDGWMVVG
jgi:hypothetical protein